MNHMGSDSTGIRIEQTGAVGFLVLARPAVLNSLDGQMITALLEGLQQLEADARVKLIVIRSDSDRAFCAGGNMKRIRQLSLDKDYAHIDDFFTQEYALNLAIANCSKPYLALIDGVAMGGGLGLSVHGSYVIVTERALLAMPETRIGFFPDVGASHFLPPLPCNSGMWLALTAAPVKGIEAVHTKLATHYVPSDKLAGLVSALSAGLDYENKPGRSLPGNTSDQSMQQTDTQIIEQILNAASQTPNASEFLHTLQQRGEWFAGKDINLIRERLHKAAGKSADAAHMLHLLDGASPYSISLIIRLFEQTQNAHGDRASLAQCLQYERQLSAEAVRHPDFIEGVRAVLVDKDHQANWQH